MNNIICAKYACKFYSTQKFAKENALPSFVNNAYQVGWIEAMSVLYVKNHKCSLGIRFPLRETSSIKVFASRAVLK